jgi:hypothetical protein
MRRKTTPIHSSVRGRLEIAVDGPQKKVPPPQSTAPRRRCHPPRRRCHPTFQPARRRHLYALLAGDTSHRTGSTTIDGSTNILASHEDRAEEEDPVPFPIVPHYPDYPDDPDSSPEPEPEPQRGPCEIKLDACVTCCRRDHQGNRQCVIDCFDCATICLSGKPCVSLCWFDGTCLAGRADLLKDGIHVVA